MMLNTAPLARRTLLAGAGATLLVAPARAASADADRRQLVALIDQDAPRMAKVARDIWTWAEVGYQETRSSALLQSELAAAGFQVKAGVASIPTAFVASFKTGEGPVIAIMAEFDALPGLAQNAVPEHSPIPGQAAGHACGHHIFGAASVSAAKAVAAWMKTNKLNGEIRLYGTPAEEGGSGKVYMVRAGLFDDVGTVLHWHPSDVNDASQQESLANISGKFRFYGVAAQASAAPEQGRSALDGVEIMNTSVNYMREHVPSDVRIHYVTTDGGRAPNVVPDFAEVYYYVRAREPSTVRSVMARVQKAAEGAALATETKVAFEATGGVYNMLPNQVLGQIMDASLREVGGETWSPEDRAFAEAMVKQLLPTKLTLDSVKQIQPYTVGVSSGSSTDVSDVSWVTPTVGMSAATWVPGTRSHSWQAAAAGGTGIAEKGGVVAAKTLSVMAAKLLRDPSIIRRARAELEARRGAGFTYSAMVGDRAPPLDYRSRAGAG